ncbi:hypothetical protein CALCODRAFT_103019 [Calocera cornea HHB12733]|uniref:Uncharacterized protein n=1 Tax=Calocera cornea HHB12733 TaxID=1353952 RepID=A0A165D5F4_9BASI|nr:hypothetical protein CALCODRAFT_103019 [Calocera cornea HHB12733]
MIKSMSTGGKRGSCAARWLERENENRGDGGSDVIRVLRRCGSGAAAPEMAELARHELHVSLPALTSCYSFSGSYAAEDVGQIWRRDRHVFHLGCCSGRLLLGLQQLDTHSPKYPGREESRQIREYSDELQEQIDPLEKNPYDLAHRIRPIVGEIHRMREGNRTIWRGDEKVLYVLHLLPSRSTSPG